MKLSCAYIIVVAATIAASRSDGRSAVAFARPPRHGSCMATGLDILSAMQHLKRVKATFDLEKKNVYYRIRFCHQVSMCFATTLDHHPINENVVNDVEPWAKLIQTIQGKAVMTPYSRDTHADLFGGDYYNCSSGYYVIISKPSLKDILRMKNKVVQRHVTSSQTNCLSQRSCQRTCLHRTEKRERCHEVRLTCNFKCSKRRRDDKRSGR